MAPELFGQDDDDESVPQANNETDVWAFGMTVFVSKLYVVVT